VTTNPYDAGTDWQVVGRTWKVDGDTVRILRCRDVIVADGMRARIYDDPAWFPRGQAVRIVNLDTPEHGQPGWQQAGDELTAWLAAAGDDLMVTTWGMSGGFDRLLGDFWIAGDRNNTVTRWMLTEGNGGNGWLPYVRGA